MPTQEHIEKLPRWAQILINKLQADVVCWKEKALAASSPNAEDTNTFVIPIIEPNRGLPPDTIIGFKLGKETVTVQAKKDRLQVRASMVDALIHPVASNVFEVLLNAS